MNALSIGLFASLTFALLPPAHAKQTCTIESYQPIDIPSDTSGGILDEETGQFLVTQKPPMRCASITFTTSKTRDRIASHLSGSFNATYYDEQSTPAYSIEFDENELEAGYIRIGPHTPVEAYVCFSTSETPIKALSCDVQ